MDRERFDALARLLAIPGSRRAALGALLGAGLAGAGVDALARKGKSARKGRGDKKRNGGNRNKVKASGKGQGNDNANLGNSVCAKWCHDNFSGKEAGQCTAAAAKGEGPCYDDCGPQAGPVVCGAEFCDRQEQKCCNDHCIAYDVCCTGNLAATPPVPGVEGRCLPKTNDQNRAAGDPHVNQLASGSGQVTLEFVNPKTYVAFFEVRLDGEKITCGREHPIVIGDWRYPGECLGSGCATGPGPVTVTRTYDAEFVEVRLALGGERDHDFSSDNGSGWVRFDDDFQP